MAVLARAENANFTRRDRSLVRSRIPNVWTVVTGLANRYLAMELGRVLMDSRTHSDTLHGIRPAFNTTCLIQVSRRARANGISSTTEKLAHILPNNF